MFKPVDNKLDFPKMEHRILDFWEETDAFDKLREQNEARRTMVVHRWPHNCQ